MISRDNRTDDKYQRATQRYVLGFGSALVITYLMYFSVANQWFEGWRLATWLLMLAIIQFVLQLVVFLHVGREKKPRWTMWSIIYTLAMMMIIALASIWIMDHLNYNMMMTPEQMQQYMLEQNKKGF